MSLHTCHCGSNHTTYKGLRIHQGKMGCTPKGLRIPESERIRPNNYVPSLTHLEPRIEIPEDFVDIFTSAAMSGGDNSVWINLFGANRREVRPFENNPASRESSDVSLQVCSCGWRSVTTYHGLRTHQGKMGCIPSGARPSLSNTFRFNSFSPPLTFPRASIQEITPSVENTTLPSEPAFTPQLTFPGFSINEVAPFGEFTSLPSKSEAVVNSGPETRAESRPHDGRTLQSVTAQQEVMGYSPNGSIPLQGNNLGFDSFTNQLPFPGPSFQEAAPSRETYSTSSESEDDENTEPEPWAQSHQNDGITVQGPRTQQEGMGYTPNGARPPLGNISGSNSSAAHFVFGRPSVQNSAPPRDIFTKPSMSETVVNTGPEPRVESRPHDGITVQGPRTQQEVMGYTPNGVRPLQGNISGSSSSATEFVFGRPSVQNSAPSRDIFTKPSMSEAVVNTGPETRAESRQNDGITVQSVTTQQDGMGYSPNGARPLQGNISGSSSSATEFVFGRPSVQNSAPSRDIFTKPSKSEAVVNTGPETRAESRPNDGITVQSNNLGFNSFAPKYSLSGTSFQEAMPSREVITNPTKSDGEKKIPKNEQEKSPQKSQSAANMPANTSANTKPPQVSPVSTPKPAAKDVKVETNSQSMFETPPPSTQVPDRAPRVRRELDFQTAAQQPPLEPKASLPSGTQAKPTTKEVKVEGNTQSMSPSPRTQVPDATSRVRQTLDFQSGAQQVEQLTLNIPTTASQETIRSQEMEKERQREEQQAAKAIHDKIRADIQLKILRRQQKMGEVRSSAKVFKGRLDAEWLEINTVFSDVIKAVEAAREEALQPLERRRQKVDKEEDNLIQKLQKEIDALRQTIDELEQNQDVQVSPPTGHDETLKTATVDTLFSFGTLRTTTSNMMQNIQEKLEKLSTVELMRTPKYAVDVRLDPSTAHPYLHISADGKTVCDGGKDQRVPLSPERFDTFGSILGLNRLTSGKSYWEVEVRDKSGWDLGVARGDANRKGKLSLSPDNRFWVIVHFENDKYAALTTSPVNLALTQKPERVGVFVDYEEGLVSFYDVTAKSHIYSFTSCSFEGEIFPYFSPHLRQNEKNSAPLVITALRKQRYIS